MESNCPGSACFELLGRKWTAHVVWALGDGPRRFSELVEAVSGVSDRVLTRRLRELEALGIVKRKVHAEIPPRVHYELTARGRDLRPVVDEMERWSTRWGQGRGPGPKGP